MEQREIDNMLLSMIQKHFPSLPLSDKHTDWGKWLCFARAAYAAGRASHASVPEGWNVAPDVPTATMCLAGEKALSEHDFLRMDSAYCAMLAAAPTPPVSEDHWLPIETAPKDGTMFLCWVSAERYSQEDGGGSGIGHDVSQIDFCWWRSGPIEMPDAGYFDPSCGQIGDAQAVTHWMPLPKAPAMEGK